jgi:NAD+-dependent protein deacetylase SIR2
VMHGLIPHGLSIASARIARSARATRVGFLRPAIVLYDEPHPLGDDIGAIQTSDLSRKPDLLIIMGTSMKVHGLKKLVKDFAKTIHAPSAGGKPSKGLVLFVNRTPPSSEWSDVIDYHVAGNTDDWVESVIHEWKKSRPQDWEVQQTLMEVNGSPFKVVKEARVATTKKPKGSWLYLLQKISLADLFRNSV